MQGFSLMMFLFPVLCYATHALPKRYWVKQNNFYGFSMEYKWDNRTVTHLSKQGVSFEEAKMIFDDPCLWISMIQAILTVNTVLYYWANQS